MKVCNSVRRTPFKSYPNFCNLMFISLVIEQYPRRIADQPEGPSSDKYGANDAHGWIKPTGTYEFARKECTNSKN